MASYMSSSRHDKQNSAALFYNRFASGMNSPEVMMQGTLLKLGNVARSFKLRYFVLYKNRKLAYWPSQTEEIYGKDPMGMLSMHEVRAVKIVNKPPKQKKPKKGHEGDADEEDQIGDEIVIDFEKTRYFCFELRMKYRTYLFCCDDALHFNDWIMHLNNAVFGKKLFKGWFVKQGAKAKSWRKRWFVVFDTLEMRYYENQKGNKPKGAIMLTELTEINMVLDTDKYPKHEQVMELITPERIWVLSAPSKDDRSIWYSRLCDLIGKNAKKKCFRLNPIYNNYLFQYDEATKVWTQRYYALTPKHLYYFDNAEQCDNAQSIAYFDKARFHIGVSRYVSGFIPLNNPTFTICDSAQCKLHNKQHLFEIDTSFQCKILMAAAHKSEIDEWQHAFIKMELLDIHNSDEEEEEKKRSTLGINDAFSQEILSNLKQSTSKRRKKHTKSSSNSLNYLSMKTHFPGFTKKGKKSNISELKDGDEDKEDKEDEKKTEQDVVKDGYNDLGSPVDETNLPKPKPRKSTNPSIVRPPKKRVRSYKNGGKSFTIKRIGVGGAGNVGKVDPFKRSKTDRNERYVRDRTKSRSLNEVMFKELGLGTGSYGSKSSHMATSYNPNRTVHYLPKAGPNAADFKFDSNVSVRSSAMNLKGGAYTPQVMSECGSSLLLQNNDSYYTSHRVSIPMISPTPSRHASLDMDSMANNVASTRHLSVTYNASTRISVSKSYVAEDELFLSPNRKSMLAKQADNKIVKQLMELGFVDETHCEKAAIATNNRGVEEAQQWLFNNLQQNELNNASARSLAVSVVSDIYENGNESESDSDVSSIAKGLFAFQINDVKQNGSKSRIFLNDEERNTIMELSNAAERAQAYFAKNQWNEAIKEYTIALNEIDTDMEAEHEFAFRYYCLRSECFRRLKIFSKAENDTECWMELRFNRGDFEYIEGCEVGSAIYIDMKQYALAKDLVVRGLEIDAENEKLQQRLKKLEALLSLELAEIAREIDRKYLEYDIDEIIDNELSEREEKENDLLTKSKEQRAMTVISEWESLVKNKSQKQLEKEAKQIVNCCTNYLQCPCIARVTVILRFYDKWCSTQETATILDRISIYNIIIYLRSYSLHQLINDFVHIKEAHIDNVRQQRCEIFEYFVNMLPECIGSQIDNLNDCKCFRRNNRNKLLCDQNENEFKKMYFNFSRSGEVRDIITMQILDSLHSFCIHSTQCIMMKVPENNSFTMSSFLKQPQTVMNNINNEWEEIYKFKTNIKAEEKEEEDMIEMDDGIVIGQQVFKYCVSYKKDTDFIKAKYKTLKRELMKNKIFCITEPEWFTYLLRASILKQTYKGKMTVANNINNGALNEKYHIATDLPIPITHILVLLLYTNNINLQFQFRQCLLSNKRKKIREIGNFMAILSECILFYGHSNYLFMSSAIFYHGLSQKILIDNFEFVCNIPTLISLEPSSAMMVCEKNRNCILQFRSESNECKLFDISWLSDNPFNNTFLTGCASSFNILDIINEYESNEIFISALLFFKKVVNGYYIQDIIHPKQVYQYIILGLMSNMSEGYAEHSNIPKFMQSLFEYIVNKIDSIWIIKSQFEKLGNDLRTCFFNINEEESITTGPFYDYWMNKLCLPEHELSVNLTQEFEWNLVKQDDLLRFWGLAQNQCFCGPECDYIIYTEDEEEDSMSHSEEDDGEDIICFIPIIFRSHSESKDNVSIGIKLKDPTVFEKYATIKIQYNLLCPQLRYTLSNIAVLDEENQTNQCIAFNINQIKTLNAFHFQISLRVLTIEY